jgi:hypothetical protein
MSKLPQLEQRIREKIQQVKDEVHPAHNKIYLETLNLRIEIETLNWVLNEIGSLSQNTGLKENQR